MKKEVIEDLLHTIQVILNWVVFENELTYLCFSAMCKEIKLIEINADVMGRFIQEESHRKYEYNYFFFSQFAQSKPEESLDILINFVHHEMTHYYCFLKGIKSTDGLFHTEAFKEAIERFNGSCRYVNDVYGWTDSRLNPEALETVKATLKYLNTNRINVKETKA